MPPTSAPAPAPIAAPLPPPKMAPIAAPVPAPTPVPTAVLVPCCVAQPATSAPATAKTDRRVRILVFICSPFLSGTDAARGVRGPACEQGLRTVRGGSYYNDALRLAPPGEKPLGRGFETPWSAHKIDAA